MWYNLFCIALAATLFACSPPSTPTPSATATVAPSPSTAATNAPTAQATDGSIRSPTLPPDTPTPVLDPASACAELATHAQPGLYLLAVRPVPALVWDRVPRQFLVNVCNSSTETTAAGTRFVVFAYFPGEVRPRGQTSELLVRLEPGLHELTLESWTPGLQNHLSACRLQPWIDLSVAYTFPPDLSTYHPIPFVDGKDKVAFAVKCAGNFP